MVSDVIIAPERDRRLILRNPLIAGPGTIGYGRETAKILPLDRLGAVITNTTTLRPRAGAHQPRLAETPAGIMLATGMQNPGLRTVLRRYTPTWERLGSPVILSLAGDSVAAFAECAHLVEEVDSIAGLELEPDLLSPGADMVQVVDKIRSISQLPLIVRLPVGAVTGLVDAIVDLSAVGCDAVIVGSPWPGLVMDAATKKPHLIAGVAGPAIRPLALRLVYEVCKLLGPEHIPLMAAGGVSSADDVAAFLAAGASAVLLDTLLYVDSGAIASLAATGSGTS